MMDINVGFDYPITMHKPVEIARTITVRAVKFKVPVFLATLIFVVAGNCVPEADDVVLDASVGSARLDSEVEVSKLGCFTVGTGAGLVVGVVVGVVMGVVMVVGVTVVQVVVG